MSRFTEVKAFFIPPRSCAWAASSLLTVLEGTPSSHSESFPPNLKFLCVPCWNWPSLNADSAYTKFAALYPVTGALLPTLREVHACSWCDHCCGSQEPQKEQSSRGGTAACRLTPPGRCPAHQTTLNPAQCWINHSSTAPAVPRTSHPPSVPRALPFALTETQHHQTAAVTSATHRLPFQHFSSN